jgi:hypothetical protein
MSNIVEELNKLSNARDRKLFLKDVRKYINSESNKFPIHSFIEIPLLEHQVGKNGLVKAMRSRDYLAQVYSNNDIIRLSVNCVRIKNNGHWEDGISWETLMSIKHLVGYGDCDAVEVYPKDVDVVNVANIRHLFILNKPLPFIWRRLNKEND